MLHYRVFCNISWRVSRVEGVPDQCHGSPFEPLLAESGNAEPEVVTMYAAYLERAQMGGLDSTGASFFANLPPP